jgi:hypothetical protein
MAEKPDKPDTGKPAAAAVAPKSDAGKPDKPDGPDPGKQTTAQALASARPVSSSAPGSAPPGGADSPPNMFASQATGPGPSEQGSGQGPGQGQGQQAQQGQAQGQGGQPQGGQSSQASAGQQAPQGQDKTVQGATDPTSVPGPMFQGDPAAQNIYLGVYSDVQSGRTVEVVHPSVFKEGDEQAGAHVMYRDMGNDRFYFTPLSEFAQQGKYARRS